MTNRRRRFALLLPLWVALALLLAFLLRGLILWGVIQPILYLFWLLKLLYRAVPQLIVWAALVAVLSLSALSFITRNFSFGSLFRRKREPRRGPLQELARAFQRQGEGAYFKWQVARLLAETALDLQELRLHDDARALNFDENPAPAEVRRYLDSGLNTSFSDYSAPRLLRPKPETPFDIDLERVIDYLESQQTKMEHL